MTVHVFVTGRGVEGQEVKPQHVEGRERAANGGHHEKRPMGPMCPTETQGRGQDRVLGVKSAQQGDARNG